MSGLDGFPRRKRTAHQRTVGHARAVASMRPSEPAAQEATQEALDIAGYVFDMAAQLEAMSAAVDLDLLAYFLGMAKAEAELFLRTSAETGPKPLKNEEVADRAAQSGESLD